MHLLYTLASILASHTSVAVGDFLTPTYPTPADLSSNHSLVHAGWKNLTSTFDQYLHGHNSSATITLKGIENVTFSVGMFSLSDPEALRLQYHHTSPEIKTAKIGTQNVDENSIYRVASVSKLVTVFAGMLTLSDDEWNRPLTKINAHFKRQKNNSTADVIKYIQWDKVTPWALASQLSGVPTLGILGDSYNMTNPSVYGGPLVNISSLGPCVAKIAANPMDQSCSTDDMIDSIKNLPGNFEPWKTPVYSDLNFMLLGVAISNITNKTMTDVYNSAIFHPLNMNSSSDTSPTDGEALARSVVAGAPAANFAVDIPFTTPSGGILSTISDLQRLGIAILNNTLLSRASTDKWMKPISHTASLSYSIGAPWEIHRFVHPKTGKVTDIYTKLGDSGYYGGVLALIPQYNAGFTFLNAATSPNRSTTALRILDHITATMLPALEAEAVAEAKRNFVGTYESTGGDIKATLKIGFNESSPGSVHSNLVVTEWTFNGTDILSGPFFLGQEARLEQSIVKYSKNGKPRQIAFLLSSYNQTPTYMDATKLPETGVIGSWTGLYYSNGDFTFTDQQRWAGQPIRELVFDIDEHGSAVKCTPVYQRVELKRCSK